MYQFIFGGLLFSKIKFKQYITIEIHLLSTNKH